jgi:hypothetical protein
VPKLAVKDMGKLLTGPNTDFELPGIIFETYIEPKVVRFPVIFVFPVVMTSPK